MTHPSKIAAFSVGWSLHSILIGLGPLHNLISSVGSPKIVGALYHMPLWGSILFPSWLAPLLELLLDREMGSVDKDPIQGLELLRKVILS
jgi:hypothetical protein